MKKNYVLEYRPDRELVGVFETKNDAVRYARQTYPGKLERNSGLHNYSILVDYGARNFDIEVFYIHAVPANPVAKKTKR